MKQKTRRKIFYLVVILVLIFATLSVATRARGNDHKQGTYIVQPGDTIWDIAEQYCPSDMDIREWIYEVREINRIDCLIRPGQELQIIKEES